MFGAEVLAFTCPGRGAAFSTLLRGAGTHKYGTQRLDPGCCAPPRDAQHPGNVEPYDAGLKSSGFNSIGEPCGVRSAA